MRFFKIYGRVLGALGSDTRLAWLLGGASLLVAALQFLDPVLFGRVIGLLTYADQLPRNRLWAEAAQLLGIWFVVGGVGILASMATALHAERDGTIAEVLVRSGDQIDAKDLLVVFAGET